MTKPIDIRRNAAHRIVSIHLHRSDASRLQSRAQDNLRSAFPYDDPPPLPEDVQEARQACAESYDDMPDTWKWVVAVIALAFAVVAGWIAWHLPGVGR